MRTSYGWVLVAVSACTFPEITIVVDDGLSGGGGASPADSTGVGAAGGGGGTTVSTSSTTDTTTTMSTSSNGGGGAGGGECPDVDEDGDDSIVCGGTDCDDDGDGVQVEFEGCCMPPGCDCADTDDRVKPGQAGWFGTAWDGADNYDYNCSFFEEPRYTTACPQSGILNCGEGKVFVGQQQPCGITADARSCGGLGLGTCSPTGSVYQLLQECH